MHDVHLGCILSMLLDQGCGSCSLSLGVGPLSSDLSGDAGDNAHPSPTLAALK